MPKKQPLTKEDRKMIFKIYLFVGLMANQHLSLDDKLKLIKECGLLPK